MVDIPKEVVESALEAIEAAKATGSLKKGTNEVTKAIERGTAKLVAYAKDVSPKEIVMHIPLLAKEKGIPCVGVDSKEELGAAAGLGVGTGSVAIIKEGQAKKIVEEISRKLGTGRLSEGKEEAPAEESKEESAADEQTD